TLVASLVPNLNRAMADAIRMASSTTPFVTILTDFADYPPHFWIEEESEYVIWGTQSECEQAIAMGHDPDRVFLTSGMIVNPSFYTDTFEAQATARERLGLRPNTPTGIVTFGGGNWLAGD